MSDRQWRLLSAAIVLIAAGLRFYHLALVPLHHDEGVNGLFLTTLFRTGAYQYDPSNYHGPTLYYLALVLTTANAFLFGKAGLSTVAIRSVPAIFGTATVWLVLKLRRYLGALATLGAAAFVALSPGAVYVSRYFIHEVPFVFFTLALAVAALRYQETSRPAYLWLASASAALLFATKETAIISVVVLVLAYLCAVGYLAWRKTGGQKLAAGRPIPPSHSLGEQPADDSGTKLISQRDRVGVWVVALALFLSLYILFYSSFGSNYPKGVYDSIATFRYWSKTAASDARHDHFTYLRWLGRAELPALLLGLLGFAIALGRGCNRFALFSGFWTMGMLAAYSLIPYKTPWLALNISVPLALVAGYGLAEVYSEVRRIRRQRMRVFLVALLGMALVTSAYQAIDISFFRYDDDSLPYVYAHTQRQFLDLVDRVNQIAARNRSGVRTNMTIAAANYWPLPWYLRDYPNAGYWGHVVPTQEAVVIAEESQQGALMPILDDRYDRIGSYNLRPGVVLVLFVRRDVAR
ncbi:MAG TPA: flippase activity-associated protein Agl23 [Terriglobales bacterium]|nr:flippase activity-associated protein Agl23 [Terriglobales bacterium]